VAEWLRHWACSSQHPSGLENRKKPEQVVVGVCPEGIADHVTAHLVSTSFTPSRLPALAAIAHA
jgi:hypothetical protein